MSRTRPPHFRIVTSTKSCPSCKGSGFLYHGRLHKNLSSPGCTLQKARLCYICEGTGTITVNERVQTPRDLLFQP